MPCGVTIQMKANRESFLYHWATCKIPVCVVVQFCSWYNCLLKLDCEGKQTKPKVILYYLNVCRLSYLRKKNFNVDQVHLWTPHCP